MHCTFNRAAATGLHYHTEYCSKIQRSNLCRNNGNMLRCYLRCYGVTLLRCLMRTLAPKFEFATRVNVKREEDEDDHELPAATTDDTIRMHI